MSNPFFSIICPCFNSSRWVKEAIDSVIKQNFKNWELILIDDDSDDETYKIINDFQSLDSRLVVLKNKVNKGPFISRNKGIKKASGNYILFLDSDDLFSLNALEFLYSILYKNDYDACFFNFSSLRSNNDPYQFKTQSINDNKELIIETILNNNFSCSLSTKCFKKSLITNGLLDKQEDIRYGEDLLFFLSLIKKINFVYIVNEPLYEYRNINNHSLCTGFSNVDIYCNNFLLVIFKRYDFLYVYFNNDSEKVEQINKQLSEDFAYFILSLIGIKIPNRRRINIYASIKESTFYNKYIFFLNRKNFCNFFQYLIFLSFKKGFNFILKILWFLYRIKTK